MHKRPLLPMACLLVVSGASRGFGKCMLQAFLESIRGPVIAICCARNRGLLESAVSELQKAQKDARFIVCAFDMADLDSIQPSWAAALAAATAAAGPAGFTRAILINNSGSLGDMSSCADLPSLSSLRAAMDANITGVMWMTSLFLKWMQSAAGPVSTGEPSLIINVSSLAAIKPFPTQLTYCVGKAARDMLHAGLAEELQQAQEAGRLRCAVKTLNYAPGPLDTDMQSELRDSSTLLPSTRTFFIQMKAEGTLVMPTQSAMKCARLVQANRFTSGAHIDYYEEEP